MAPPATHDEPPALPTRYHGGRLAHLWFWMRWAVDPRPSRRQVLSVLLLALIAGLPSLRFALRPYPNLHEKMTAWDDWHILTGLDAGHDLFAALGWWHGDWPEGNRFYRPLSGTSLWLDYLVWRWEPWGYLMTSWFLYALTAAALGPFATALTGRREIGVAALVVFACVPRDGGRAVMSFLNARSEVLCGLFILLALYAGLRYARHGAGRFLAAMSLAAALALFSKELGMCLPGLMGLTMLLARDPGPWRRRLGAVATVAVVVIAWYWLYLSVLPGRMPVPGGPRPRAIPSTPYFWLTCSLTDVYRTLLWVRTGPALSDLSSPWLLRSALQAVASLALVSYLVRRNWRLTLFCLAWVPLSWLPMLSTYAGGGHYFHVPQIGVMMATGALAWMVGAPVLSWLRRESRRPRLHIPGGKP